MVTGAHAVRDAWLGAVLIRAAAALACLLFLGLFTGCKCGPRGLEGCGPVDAVVSTAAPVYGSGRSRATFAAATMPRPSRAASSGP